MASLPPSWREKWAQKLKSVDESEEIGPQPPTGSTYRKLHPDLDPNGSQEGGDVSVPIPRPPPMRSQSLVTSGGRVIRNITENKSVKFNFDSAVEKYPEDFSGYGNPFRKGPNQQSLKPTPSLRRDGKLRRHSSKDRPISIGGGNLQEEHC